MKSEQSIDCAQQNRQVAIFKMLANANRLKIIKAIHSAPEKTLNVTSLCQILKMSAPKISDHLKLLRTNKILKAKQMGANMFYSIRDIAVINVIKSAA